MEKILFLGTDGFSSDFSANVQKQKLISKSLIEAGYDVTIVCRRGTTLNPSNEIQQFRGVTEGINYFYASFSSSRSCNYLSRNVSKLIGFLVEPIYILAKSADIIIINGRSFTRIVEYALLSKIKHCKVILTYVEDNDFVPSKQSVLRKLNNKLFNKYVWRIVDGAFPISRYLSEKIDYSNSSLPRMLLPIFVDIRSFDESSDKFSCYHEPYFLYCGSAGYQEVIKFILDSFNEAKVRSNLLIIVSGSSSQVKSLKEYAKYKRIENRVVFKQNVSDIELRCLYKGAKALLIPMRENARDKARFPHKLGEYCASKRPIVTNDWGEISYYFKHNENCFIIEKYNRKYLARAIEKLEYDEDLCKRIGMGGYLLAKQNFDYLNYSNKFKMFISSIQ